MSNAAYASQGEYESRLVMQLDATNEEVSAATDLAMAALDRGDYIAARSDLVKVCEMGLGPACYLAGNLFALGRGGPVDKPFAQDLYYAGCYGARDGFRSGDACYSFGIASREKWNGRQVTQAGTNFAFALGCELGSAKACYESGTVYLGYERPDINRAGEEFLRGCELENAASCYAVGTMIRDVGVQPRDGENAQQYFDKSCRLDQAFCE